MLVAVGQEVSAGDTLVTVSAMKMEVKVTAPAAAAPAAGGWKVVALDVPMGGRVVEGALLVTLAALE